MLCLAAGAELVAANRKRRFSARAGYSYYEFVILSDIPAASA